MKLFRSPFPPLTEAHLDQAQGDPRPVYPLPSVVPKFATRSVGGGRSGKPPKAEAKARIIDTRGLGGRTRAAMLEALQGAKRRR